MIMFFGIKKKLYRIPKRLPFLIFFVADTIGVILSACLAYNFRFSNSVENSRLSIANIDYRSVLIVVVILWMSFLIASGVYRSSHLTLMVYNLRVTTKRSLLLFLLIGFVSFIFNASFSRTIFLLMLLAGLINIFCIRSALYFLLFKPLILTKRIATNLMIIGRTRSDLEQHSEWLMKNRTFGFSVVSRLECPSITTNWIEEFEIGRAHV